MYSIRNCNVRYIQRSITRIIQPLWGSESCLRARAAITDSLITILHTCNGICPATFLENASWDSVATVAESAFSLACRLRDAQAGRVRLPVVHRRLHGAATVASRSASTQRRPTFEHVVDRPCWGGTGALCRHTKDGASYTRRAKRVSRLPRREPVPLSAPLSPKRPGRPCPIPEKREGPPRSIGRNTAETRDGNQAIP